MDFVTNADLLKARLRPGPYMGHLNVLLGFNLLKFYLSIKCPQA